MNIRKKLFALALGLVCLTEAVANPVSAAASNVKFAEVFESIETTETTESQEETHVEEEISTEVEEIIDESQEIDLDVPENKEDCLSYMTLEDILLLYQFTGEELEGSSGVVHMADGSDFVSVYSEMNVQSEAVGKIYDRNTVTLVDYQGDWCKVTSGNVTGYILSRKILVNPSPEAALAPTYGETLAEEEERIAKEEAEAAEQKSIALGESLAEYAQQFVGNPYKAGGSSLTEGTDCSGFVMALYAVYGYDLPHPSDAQQHVGYEVALEDVRPGDIICYTHHSAIYIGDGKIVHAAGVAYGICISNMYYRQPLCARRVF